MRALLKPACVLAALLPAWTGSAAAPGIDPAVVTQDLARLITFIDGGTPPTPAELQQLGGFVAAKAAQYPAEWQKYDGLIRDTLRKAAAGGPAQSAELRVRLRAAEARGDASVQKAILAAHDPVVAADPSGSRVVTRTTLAGLERATQWMAQQARRPGPDASFQAREAAVLARDFARWPAAQQDQFVYIDRNFILMQNYFHTGRQDKVSHFFQTLHDRNIQDPVEQAANTANMAAYAATLSTSTGGAAGVAGTGLVLNQALRTQMMQQQLLSMQRAMSPSCGLGNLGSGYCSP